MADLDLGDGSAACGSSAEADRLSVEGGLRSAVLCGSACVAERLSVAGGLRAAVLCGSAVVAALGGVWALAGACGGGSSCVGELLRGEVTVVSLAGVSAGVSAVSASELFRERSLRGAAFGASQVAGRLWVSPRGVSAGASAVLPALLRRERALSGAAAGGSACGGNLAWDVRLEGAAAGGSEVSTERLDVSVPLQGLCGAPGWERPQLAGASAGASVAHASGLSISGLVTVELSS
jgi:hypothetical protein